MGKPLSSTGHRCVYRTKNGRYFVSVSLHGQNYYILRSERSLDVAIKAAEKAARVRDILVNGKPHHIEALARLSYDEILDLLKNPPAPKPRAIAS